MSGWLGRTLFFLLLVGVLLALFVWLRPYMPFIGKLPGDITFTAGRTIYHLPLATCLLVSLVLASLVKLLRGK